MPQFSNHLPASARAIKEARTEYRRVKSLPIGLIGESASFAYGWDGKKYYVTEGVFQFFVTRIHLTMDEAKQLFNALSFNNCYDPCSKKVNYAIKEARKNRLSGDFLFWFFTDKF